MPFASLRSARPTVASTVAVLAGCGSPAGSGSLASDPSAPRGTPVAAPESGGQAEVEGVQTTVPSADPSVRTFRIVPAQSEASYDVQEKLVQLPAPTRAV